MNIGWFQAERGAQEELLVEVRGALEATRGALEEARGGIEGARLKHEAELESMEEHAMREITLAEERATSAEVRA